jgi:acetylornithine aminotransferase
MVNILPLVSSGSIEIVKSEACFLFDSGGERYIDMESGVWCVNLGHNHNRINRAIEQQLKKTIHLGYQVKSRLPEKLSESLLEKLKLYGGKSVFLSSGSEAVDLSISIAKHITGRKKLCSIEGSYLSAYGQGASALPNKELVSIRNNDYEKLSSTDFSKIAAFIFEPGNAWGMISFPSTEFIAALVKKARSGGTLIICDEVTTGMGRTGKWFGFEHYRLSPDIVACGKGLGNGYPVSAVSLNRITAEAFEKNPFRYAQSHQNDPLGCAIAVAVIKEMDRSDLVQRADEEGILYKSLLKNICLKHKEIREIRGRGLMLAIEFHKEEKARDVHQFLLENRIICGQKLNVLRLMPPLIIEHDLFLEVNKQIEESLS